jgi:hypothetical protein
VFGLRARQEIAAAASSASSMPWCSLDAVVFSGDWRGPAQGPRASRRGPGVLGVAGSLDPARDRDHIISRGGAPVPLVRPASSAQIAREIHAVLQA